MWLYPTLFVLIKIIPILAGKNKYALVIITGLFLVTSTDTLVTSTRYCTDKINKMNGTIYYSVSGQINQ